MMQRSHFGFDFVTTAGLRLRCFFGKVLLLALFLSTVRGALHAQIDVEAPIRLSHVSGYVVDSWGKPVAHVEVTLSRDETVVHSTRTDQAGAFNLEHVSGKYWFRVARSDYAPAAHEIVVTEEVVTRLERKKLYVIVGPGACTDECSSVFTSKQQFDHAIRKKNGH